MQTSFCSLVIYLSPPNIKKFPEALWNTMLCPFRFFIIKKYYWRPIFVLALWYNLFPCFIFNVKNPHIVQSSVSTSSTKNVNVLFKDNSSRASPWNWCFFRFFLNCCNLFPLNFILMHVFQIQSNYLSRVISYARIISKHNISFGT